MPAEVISPPTAFFSISLEMIEPGDLLPCDLWLRPANGDPVLYRAAHLPFLREHLERLEQSGVEVLHIAFEDAAAWSDFVAERLKSRILDPNRPIEERVDELLSSSRAMMREVFDDPRGPGVRRTIEHLGDAVNRLIAEPGAFHSAVRLMEHDYYTYTHCFHVSVYSVGLGRAAGIDDENYLTSLGQGGLIHDVGKTSLPASLINKPGRLTDNEFRLMKTHPEQGIVLLDEMNWRDPIVRDVTLSHHERLDGSGYPRGLKGDSVTVAARISAICDAFDAMTTDRSYSRGMSSLEALKILRGAHGRRYDQRLLETFIRMLLDPEKQA